LATRASGAICLMGVDCARMTKNKLAKSQLTVTGIVILIYLSVNSLSITPVLFAREQDY
jgi:hypothetical protein